MGAGEAGGTGEMVQEMLRKAQGSVGAPRASGSWSGRGSAARPARVICGRGVGAARVAPGCPAPPMVLISTADVRMGRPATNGVGQRDGGRGFVPPCRSEAPTPAPNSTSVVGEDPTPRVFGENERCWKGARAGRPGGAAPASGLIGVAGDDWRTEVAHRQVMIGQADGYDQVCLLNRCLITPTQMDYSAVPGL